MKRYYAVKRGRTCGIFTSYERVQESVGGFSGAKYKGFNTREEAYDYLHPSTLDKIDVIEFLPEELNSNKADTLIAYVDGSYLSDINPNSYGAGIYLIHSDNQHESISLKGTEGVELRNVAGELVASMQAMNKAKEYGYKNLEIFYDYTGVEYWISGQWIPKNKYTKLYKEYYDNNIKPYINVEFTKVKSHSKNLFNDKVDALAKRALLENN